MARRVYYIFDYHRDLARVKMVGAVPGLTGVAPGGFINSEKWDAAVEEGDDAIHALVDAALENTEATVVFLGQETWNRPGIKYELEQSLKRGNALLGVQIHHIPTREGLRDQPGKAPKLLLKSGYRIFKYFDRKKLHDWVEESLFLSRKLKLEKDHSGGSSSSSDSWGDIGDLD